MRTFSKENGKVLKGKGLVASICIILIMISISLCSCGNGISGTWYYILDPDEESNHNLEFMDDTHLYYDYANFEYVKDGNDIEIPMVSKYLTVDTYENCKVIYEGDNENPSWARTYQDALKLHEIIYGGGEEETEDETAEEDYGEDDAYALTEEEASEYDSMFIKSGDKYYPLSPVRKIWNALDAWITSTDEEKPGTNSIPTLKKGDQLVLFSNSISLEDGHEYNAEEVKDMGFTIPLYFVQYPEDDDYNEDELNKDIMYNWQTLYYETQDDDMEYYDEIDEQDDDPVRFRAADIKTINGIEVDSLYKNSITIAYDYTAKVGILPFQEDEKVTIGYHQGTSYEEVNCIAGAKIYSLVGDHSEPIKVELGKEAYATFDTSKLDSGLYNVMNYIFEVE